MELGFECDSIDVQVCTNLKYWKFQLLPIFRKMNTISVVYIYIGGPPSNRSLECGQAQASKANNPIGYHGYLLELSVHRWQLDFL
jgi:hypothetical protein